MSDTFPHTRGSLRHLKAIWQKADDDDKHRLAYWLIGVAAMGVAIMTYFGWHGVAFCTGFIFWMAGSSRPQ